MTLVSILNSVTFGYYLNINKYVEIVEEISPLMPLRTKSSSTEI